jgi:hypothetical protein
MYRLEGDDTGSSWVVEFTAVFACRECKHDPNRDEVCEECTVLPSCFEIPED